MRQRPEEFAYRDQLLMAWSEINWVADQNNGLISSAEHLNPIAQCGAEPIKQIVDHTQGGVGAPVDAPTSR